MNPRAPEGDQDALRPLLFSIAYRMIGSVSEAELAESEPQFADAARRLRAESDRLP